MFKGLVEKIERPITLQELVQKQKGGQLLSVLCQLYTQFVDICLPNGCEQSFIILLHFLKSSSVFSCLFVRLSLFFLRVSLEANSQLLVASFYCWILHSQRQYATVRICRRTDQTLPKAQRTRGLSKNHKFLHKS